jgi:hypothetical protein
MQSFVLREDKTTRREKDLLVRVLMFQNINLNMCDCCLAALFEEGDVPGQQMFGFQTPKGKRALMARTPRTPKTPQPERVNGTPQSRKANGTPRSRKVNGTPRSRKVNGTPHASSHDIGTAKTPYSLRKRLKKRK